jgi:signal transduction histidine kinase
MRPLDRVPRIKLKLGLLILLSTVAATTTIVVLRELGLAWWATLLVAGAVVLVAIQVLARGMTSPLREMAVAAHAMASGDYSRRVAETSHDEVGELARSFNRMAAELGELDRFRKDLIANASHELRTPIAALQALIENLIDGVEPADPAAFAAMHREVVRLGTLVTQLLDLSKLEAGAATLERKRFAVGPVVRSAAEESTTHLLSTHGRVELRIDTDDGLTIEGDAERLRQVVANLVQNAVRHSPPSGTVDVITTRAPGGVRIEILDEGPGIPEADAERVFERFYRTDSARSAVEGGSGLGLAIARWIVDLHGGDIRVDNRQPHGCRMIVELPEVA